MVEPARLHVGARWRLSLRAKLLGVVVAVAAAMLAFLVGWFGPYTERTFVAKSDALIAESRRGLETMAGDHGANTREIVADLIRHSTDARRRALEDIPLDLYGGDVERIRQAIADEDAARAARLERNVEVLGGELARRDALRIEGHTAELTARLEAIGAAFAADLRRSYLVLSGALVGVLVLLLAFGLDRAIVRPIHWLRGATRRVADGDLEVAIPARAGDEVGDLAADFERMVRRLRRAQEEVRAKALQLEDLNANLERDVAARTRHLQEALGDLQRAQRSLLHADRMASVGTLAGGIAHEFNNLIGGIRGCLGEALADDLPDGPREALAVAQRATDRATAITQKLLRFARPRLEGATVTPIAHLVEEVVELVEPQARRQGVAVDVVLDGPLQAEVAPGEIHQVFLNLLTNALQAMPDGGRLALTGVCDGDDVVVEVADTGVGIEPADLDRVFDPFHSARVGDQGPGTGLGLSVSFGIVQAHGGALTVDSLPGRGARFTVRLPVRQAKRRAREEMRP